MNREHRILTIDELTLTQNVEIFSPSLVFRGVYGVGLLK